jgi:hypothetical protein
MAAPFLRLRDPNHSTSLDWLLVLAGALAAWLLWPHAPF